MIYPLRWGLNQTQFIKKFPTISIYEGRVGSNGWSLRNFPCDCGSLILVGATHISKDDLKLVTKIASENGFSKIFATVVSNNQDMLNNQMQRFKSARWIKVSQQQSNRNDYKTDIVYVKIIRNCKHKGY